MGWVVSNASLSLGCLFAKHAHIPPQYQLQRQHLPGHFEGPVVASIDHLEGAALRVLVADGPESGRPASSGDCQCLQDGQSALRGDSARMDSKVCHVKVGQRPVGAESNKNKYGTRVALDD